MNTRIKSIREFHRQPLWARLSPWVALLIAGILSFLYWSPLVSGDVAIADSLFSLLFPMFFMGLRFLC